MRCFRLGLSRGLDRDAGLDDGLVGLDVPVRTYLPGFRGGR